MTMFGRTLAISTDRTVLGYVRWMLDVARWRQGREKAGSGFTKGEGASWYPSLERAGGDPGDGRLVVDLEVVARARDCDGRVGSDWLRDGQGV